MQAMLAPEPGGQIMGIDTIIENLMHPSAEFTPIPFWFFNDAFDKDKIRRQLSDYVEKGVNGIVLHPRIGIQDSLEYLSEEYFHAVKYIVETAASLNMKIVLYDEGMYPSGSAHGQVVASNPAYASKGICLMEKEPNRGEVITQLSDGKYLVYDYTHGTIRGIHFGEDDGEEGAPLSADILNPEAVDCFIHLTHDRYYEALSEYFGSTVIAFFTDEPCALGRNAGKFREWLPGLKQEILAAGGSLDDLEALFNKEENDTTVIYHKLIKKHLRENFYAKLSNWCKEHGISLMGHPEASDDVEEELYFQIPGQDLIMRRVSPESGGLREFDSVQAKLCSDIARLLGRRRNANECFGVCNHEEIPWYFKGEDMIWYINWLGMRGVNLFVPHAFYYSVDGKRSGERPPDVGPNNIWWKYYRQISDYMKRISYLMTDSVDDAKVAVLCDNNRVPYEEVAALYENQIPFHYVPVALLPEAVNGSLCIRDYTFDKILNVIGADIPEKIQGIKIYRDTLKLLEDILPQCRYKLTNPCTSLRREILIKDDTEMILMCNEGKAKIDTRMEIPDDIRFVSMNLWNGEYVCEESNGEYHVQLAPSQMQLLILDKERKIPLRKACRKQNLGNKTGDFALLDKENNRARYVWKYCADRVDGNEEFSIIGEEMAECYCNGEFAGMSLYAPHRFTIGPYLHAGENEVKIVFTGSAANVYTDAEIPYGIL